MDCCNLIKRASVIQALPTGVKPQIGVALAHGSLANFGLKNSSRNSNFQSQKHIKVFGTLESRHHIYARRRRQPLVVAIANTEPSKCCKFYGVDTPVEPSSPEGMFLSRILQSERHFFQFALSELLDEMASDRNGAASSTTRSLTSMESLLQRRIAEIKDKETQIAIEDIMYMSIVYKFSEVEVPMVPRISKIITNSTVDIYPAKCRALESFHSVEVQEMIREHLATILRTREKSSIMDGLTTTKIDRLHLGRIYAASILYGYFLKSACLRRLLDSGLAPNVDGLPPLEHRTYNSEAKLYPCEHTSPVTVLNSLFQRCGIRCENLRTYVMGFDSETLQRCAKLRSKEAVNVIEKHTWALFGDEKVDQHGSDNEIIITIPSLERLVLEAVAFGSFL